MMPYHGHFGLLAKSLVDTCEEEDTDSIDVIYDVIAALNNNTDINGELARDVRALRRTLDNFPKEIVVKVMEAPPK